MKTYYFSTGVKRYGHTPALPEIAGHIWSPNGVKLIPFDCEGVPDGASFAYACDNPELEDDNASMTVHKIHNSVLVSKYAYFQH